MRRLLLALLVLLPRRAAGQETAPAQRLLLRGATVHSMVPGDEPRVADVLVEDGHIRSIGGEPPSASDLELLELAGKHLVPGLIDACVNFAPEHDALYLAAGVTLVRDLGGDHAALRRERAPERRDRVPGPALLSAGAPLDGDPPASSLAVVLRSADSAVGYLPILFEEGVDFLAVLPGLPEDAWRKTLALAHERGLPVFGPRPPALALADAIAAGQDGFHALDSLLPPGVFWDGATEGALAEAGAALAEAGKPLVPLLHASALRLEDQEGDPARLALFGLLAPSYESWWRSELALRRPFLAPERRGPGELALRRQAQALRALFDAGAALLPGSGAPQPWLFPGQALHQELAAWVQAGIPPHAALERATRGAAAALGLSGERGTLEPGAWADILVLDGDPLTDLARLLEPAWVIVRGRALAHADIEARLAELAARQAALRAELDRPVALEPPPQGEEGVVILEGTVESRASESRISTERYRVVRLAGDALLYTARLAYPATTGGSARELTIEQFVRADRLEQVHVALAEGGTLLEHDGLWTANSWRMQTRLDGQVVSTPKPLREQPLCVDVSSVTALLILAQAPLGERIPVVNLHPGFEHEPVYWRSELDDNGDHQVRTHIGQRAFRLDAVGALEFALTRVGAGLVETRALSSSAFGGPGLPLPEGKRRPAASAAPASAVNGEKPGG